MEAQKLDRRQIFKIRDKRKASSAAENSLKTVNSGTLAKWLKSKAIWMKFLNWTEKHPLQIQFSSHSLANQDMCIIGVIFIRYRQD